MEVVLSVDGMSCEHCVKAITNALSAMDGVIGVNVSLADKTVSFTADTGKISADDVKAEIEDLGYDVI